MNLFFSVHQADKFGKAFSEAILASFPDLRPTVTMQGGDSTGFGPIKVGEVMVRTDNKLDFLIEDARFQKYYFAVRPVVHGTIEDREVVVSIHWEVEGQVFLFLPPRDKAHLAFSDVIDIAQNEKDPLAPRRVLESILREKHSTITSLISEPKRVGLEEYDKAKELIQAYLDEFSAIVLMHELLDTYG